VLEFSGVFSPTGSSVSSEERVKRRLISVRTGGDLLLGDRLISIGLVIACGGVFSCRARLLLVLAGFFFLFSFLIDDGSNRHRCHEVSVTVPSHAQEESCRYPAWHGEYLACLACLKWWYQMVLSVLCDFVLA
jgi:hypothetical protein